MSKLSVHRLPVLKVLFGAAYTVWRDRGVFARGLAVPMIALTAVYICWPKRGGPLWLALAFSLVYLLLATLIAVTCHRLVLIGRGAWSGNWVPPWSIRETRFLGWMLGICFISFIAGALVALPLSGVRGIAWLVISAVTAYVAARCSLVLPAAAVDERLSFSGSWRLSRGNGWRLALIVTGLPYAMSWLVWILYRQGATMVERAVLTFLASALIALEVAALSISYRELSAAVDPVGEDGG
jgi:hypothetical protein